MVVALAELTLLVLLTGLLLYVLGTWSTRPVLRTGGGQTRLPARARTDLAAAVAQARWAPAHDEVDGVTRVLLRRAYTGLDGLPVVLEDRVFDTFPAADPAWEARFTEAMSGARFRCAYLNAEETPGA
ncbi:hypothetical protein [Geodermatophilus sabuli]|uniref:Uncharacterized protein n=1 Tax=Geodermatophilus sabuli TaxID=1564158 RepID=A0A285EDR3_9ACTN|nr:hypothetical protein [Geodermatophilus sabuli]MBB3083284.1 hypothetical protein [Geodermatophilus sabuli]SNX96993.1 hypothetical protein SAMN06893097_105335 [Geodermatophilus sabuli]